MQNPLERVTEFKTSLRNFNKNYLQTIAYCSLITAVGFGSSHLGNNFDNYFIKYTGDAIAVIGGILTIASARAMSLVNKIAKKEISVLEDKLLDYEPVVEQEIVAA
jgi:hypothetical protein